MKKNSESRTGFGFDSHVFARSGRLAIGGIIVDNCPALKGHSDGDALLHAVIDALLGAACLGDIGQMFPDTDKSLKNISSLKMLNRAVALVRGAGYRPTHVDVTVLADRPRFAPLREKIRSSLARHLSLPVASVSVKAKTQEGLRLFKAPGGIAVWAVATLTS